MKRYLSFILALIVAMSTSIIVYAETQIDSNAVFKEYSFDDEQLDNSSYSASSTLHFVNDADLLDDYKADELNSYLVDKSNSLGFDIVVVTVDSIGNATPQDYADDYYDYNGYGFGENKDGCLLLVSMEQRDWHITTTGYGIVAITDFGLDYLSDQFLPYLSDGEYYDSFISFADTVEYLVEQADNGTPYDVDTVDDLPHFSGEIDDGWFNDDALGYGCLVGLITAIIVVVVLKGKLKTVASKSNANDYLVANSFVLTHESDRFVGKTLTKTPIPKQSSSGGSSTHSGSSGTSHGGSGGKF